MISRRRILLGAGGLALPSLSYFSQIQDARAADYRALVVVFLDGGNDQNNTLVPTDGAYADYAKSRTDVLAISKDSLLSLPGKTAEHTFGFHPALVELRSMYLEKRLALLSNVGALVEPSTRDLVLSNQVRLPVGLGSHNDQAGFVQGAVLDTTGWGGRGIEALDSSFRHPVSAVAVSNHRTLVQGKVTPVSMLSDSAGFGNTDLLNGQASMTQRLNRLSRLQSSNVYEQSYIDTLKQAMEDAVVFGKVAKLGRNSSLDFGSTPEAGTLRLLSKMLPGFREYGLKRQIFLINWGGFDHHTKQRGGGSNSHDSLLSRVSKAVGAFDATNKANGMNESVLTLVASEFGRTLRPGSGEGTEHGWAGLWMAFGGMVDGGKVHGYFPSLVAGGIDDGDKSGSGRFVPTNSTDQVAATALQWMGLQPSRLVDVFPFLANFPNKTMDYLLAQ